MESRLKILIDALGVLRVKQDISIADQVASGYGSVVPYFYIATTIQELIRAVELCRDLKIPFLVFGSGTKLALPVSGVEGIVIKNRSSVIKISGIKGKVSTEGIGIQEAIVEVDSGVSIGRLEEYAQQQKLGGLDAIHGLPGTIGGNIFINPHLQSLISQVAVYTPTSEIKLKESKDVKRDDIILTAVFKLKAK